VQTITGRERSAGLLAAERAGGRSRPQRYAEKPEISDPVLEETEAVEPFLRTPQRVSVRRRRGNRLASRFGWKGRWTRAVFILLVAVALGVLAAAAWGARYLLLHDPHFRLNAADNIQITGNRVVSAAQVVAFFTPDLGHSILRVPVEKRQAQIERIRWVRRATVMRLWPNRVRVFVLERTPVAFVRDGNAIRLVDQDGVLLDLTDAASQHDSFPVLSGVSSQELLAARAAQVAQYLQFARALDAGGQPISATLSEVDLSDPEDVRAIFTGSGRQPLVHFGASDFLPRYQAYSAHLAEWLQQYPQLRSVDMRYGRQVVLDTGTVPIPSAAEANLSSASGQAPRTGVKGPAVSLSAQGKQPPATGAERPSTLKATRKAESTHHRAAAPRHRHHHYDRHRRKHVPERRYSVRHPLMHVVSGA